LKCSLDVGVRWRRSGPVSAEPSMNFEGRRGRRVDDGDDAGEEVGDDILECIGRCNG
jgi:hypothetical protein